MKFGEVSLLWDVDLLVARERELAFTQQLSHMFCILQIGVDGHDDLTSVNLVIVSLGFPKPTGV